ncbi:Hypothetical protein FRAAL2872 [Frankia alni ACN14a]|uniref:Uncharacterized protein n=1 Tax=Frankia alni (strain DSM 45986 / CECT 9034 / ACN14a) TaxID=326424 RepID=Q0RLT8_FRAAA|nr:Hypothetical protein FRAAL2872 [Frankia alni ACN14a]
MRTSPAVPGDDRDAADRVTVYRKGDAWLIQWVAPGAYRLCS